MKKSLVRTAVAAFGLLAGASIAFAATTYPKPAWQQCEEQVYGGGGGTCLGCCTAMIGNGTDAANCTACCQESSSDDMKGKCVGKVYAEPEPIIIPAPE